MSKKKVDDSREVKVIRGLKSKKIMIWSMLTFNLVAIPISGWNMLHFLKVKTEKPANNQDDPIMSQTAKAFVEDFVSAYFTRYQGFEKDRADRLKPFLMKGLDEQAGLDSMTEGNLTPGRVRVWSIEQNGPKQGIVTVQVEVYMRDKEKNDKVLATTKRFLSVPIETIGKNQFVVSGIPYFAVMSSPPEVTKTKEEIPNRVEDGTKKEVETYLKTFFQDYATGNETKLSYFTKNGAKPIKGFSGMMEFVAIKELIVFKDKSGGIGVKTKVQLREKDTKAVFTYPFTIQLEKDGNRWFVVSLATKE